MPSTSCGAELCRHGCTRQPCGITVLRLMLVRLSPSGTAVSVPIIQCLHSTLHWSAMSCQETFECPNIMSVNSALNTTERQAAGISQPWNSNPQLVCNHRGVLDAGGRRNEPSKTPVSHQPLQPCVYLYCVQPAVHWPVIQVVEPIAAPGPCVYTCRGKAIPLVFKPR